MHSWTPEHVVNESLARQLIEEQFAELLPVRIKPLGEGYDNTVYLVNDHYVFRFPRRQVAVELIQTESAILPVLVHELPMPVPEPLFIGKESSAYPWSFVGYRMVQGHTPMYMTVANQEQVAVSLAEFLHALHHFPVEKARKLGVFDDTMGRLDLIKRKPRLQEHVDRIVAMNLLPDAEALQRYATSVQEREPREGTALVHGDLHIRNLLVDDEGAVTGIIDWGDVHIGEPAIDLSIAYSFLPPEARRTFFAVYGAVTDEAKEVARFKSIYTLAHLLLYGYDQGDQKQLEMARAGLRFALTD